MPPVQAQAPMLMHHFGSGIWSQIRCNTGIIFIATRPATIIRSIPQQAVANGIGQRLNLRHQLTTESIVVTIVFSGTGTPPAVGTRGAEALVRIGRGAAGRTAMKTRISPNTRLRNAGGMPALSDTFGKASTPPGVPAGKAAGFSVA